MIKLENFADFWSALEKSETVKGASPDTDVVKWTFKDGQVLEVKQEEHSVCGSFFVIRCLESSPAVELRWGSEISVEYLGADRVAFADD